MKTIISYLFIFGLIVLYALFLDATSGFFVVVIFVVAIIISSALHVYALKTFDCALTTDAVLVEKGEEIKLTLRTSKAAFFLPTVFTVKLDLSYHFECAEDEFSVNLSRSEKEKVFVLKAAFWGKGLVGIEKVECADILGIFAPFSRFNRFNRVLEKDFPEVKVFPSIPDLSPRSEFVRILEEASAYDDNENNREVTGAVTGFPGYEHRDYIPGDPLKSVNWKLSAKRDRLLVRKPEAYAGGDQLFVLDNRSCEDIDAISARTYEQRALEAMLALSRIMTEGELICRVYVKLGEGWKLFEIDGEDELEELRFALTEYGFSGTGERLPDGASIAAQKASGFVIFTANANEGVLAAVEELKQKGVTVQVASPAHGTANAWLIEEADGEVIFTRE